jgi:Flp pilus assembly protein CpaB
VGQNLTGVKREKGQGTGSTISSDSNTSYSTVTLAVTPEQAETLMYLDGQPLKLILRAPGDDEIVPIPAQGESEVLAKLGHFSPKSTHNLEIIRGTSSQENK